MKVLRLLIPSIFFSLIALKYFITSELMFLFTSDQNHNKELRHQDLIYFLSCHVILEQ